MNIVQIDRVFIGGEIMNTDVLIDILQLETGISIIAGVLFSKGDTYIDGSFESLLVGLRQDTGEITWVDVDGKKNRNIVSDLKIGQQYFVLFEIKKEKKRPSFLSVHSNLEDCCHSLLKGMQ
ncbi:MAG: hypothetical protein Q8P11_03130 [bacterium]|nr:hypothetical protein [bacterium]